MRIGILGTGVVGKTLGTKLTKLCNDVKMGSQGRARSGDVVSLWVRLYMKLQTPNVNVHVVR